MITTLHISNYALIDNIDIDFGAGLNIITGETGAGKSIILGALGLLLGGRADLRAIRDGSRKSVIEAQFSYSSAPAVSAALTANRLDGAETDMCILRRELLPGGRSRAFVNDTPVTLTVLRDIALNLVDIHSQHQNLLLASPEYQLRIIDTLAGNGALLEEYAQAYAAYRRVLKDYTRTRDLIQRAQADEEYVRYQFEQLDSMNLCAAEDETLERERDLLSNIGEIKTKIRHVAEPLSDAPVNALGELRKAVSALESLAATIGDDNVGDGVDFHSLAERLESVRVEAADIAGTVAEYDASLDGDDGRLEQVEQRLSQIYALEAKHHVDSVGGLIELRGQLADQLNALADSDVTLAKLENAARRAKKAALSVAARLSERRTETAQAFARELRATAATLGMPNLRCEITFTRGKLAATGADQVQFLFAFNKNQALVPVGAAASGGEISRIMLSIKTIVASRMQLPSIIFDEVDTGVSGDIAARMAAMMKHISQTIQVIAITHLPGVAAMGDRHLKVFKQDDETSTNTHVRQLAQNERRCELALMLSGNASEPAALAAADVLLERAAAPSPYNCDNGKQ